MEYKLDYDALVEYIENEAIVGKTLENPNSLAQIMLIWAHRQSEADQTQAIIEDAILKLEETITVGDVRCSYYGPRTEYVGWEETIDKTPLDQDQLETLDALIEKHTTVVEKIDFKAICEEMGIGRPELPDKKPARALLKRLK
jgi:hypothetical protein